MKKYIIFSMLLIVSSFSLVQAETFGYGRTEIIPINYSLIPTVNNSQYFDGYSISTLYTYYKSLFDDVYCELTGCTMTGGIDMGGNDITNAGDITADNFIGDGSQLTDVWLTSTAQTGLTGDKTGSFDLETTGDISADALTLTNNLIVDGTTTLQGNVNLSNNKIINLADPTAAQDASTKNYTDANIFWEIDGTSGKLQPKELDNIVLLQPTLTDIPGDNFIQNAFDVQPIITPSSLMNGKYNAINGALNFGGSNTNFLVGAELNALNFIGMVGVLSNHGNDKMDVNVYKATGAIGFAVTHNVRRLTMFNSIPTDIFSGTINMEDFFGFRANQARGNNVVDRAFQSYIDRPNFGTDKNQLFLAETGEGTGIKIGGLAGANLIYEDNDRGFQNTPIHWTGTGWTRNDIWGIYNYKHTPGNTADFVLDSSYLADNAIKSGKTYRVQFWIFSATAGTLTPKLGTAAGTTISADGEKFYEVEITANADDSNLIFTPSSDYDGQIDDIFLRVIENEDFARIYSPEEKKLNIAIDDEGTETDMIEVDIDGVIINGDLNVTNGFSGDCVNVSVVGGIVTGCND